eukprot:m.329643 g.329643  ORF g.329643 m.329643 type:complete len:663 (+) comp61260_c0_seq1:83-2071(+)
MDTQDVDVLFDEEVPVHLCGAPSPDGPAASVANRIQRIFVQISIRSLSSTRKYLALRLTDAKDPFFLFNVEISEDDFAGLRQAQNIKVDFATFPSKLIELLRCCQAEASHDIPKFVCDLQTGPQAADFCVVETNTFKNLTHLHLRFAAGSDAAIKTYLAQCLRSFKEQNSRLESALQTSNDSYSSRASELQSLLERKDQERQLMEERTRAEHDQLKSQHLQELEHLRAVATQEKEVLRGEMVREHEQKLHKIMQEMQGLQQHMQALAAEKQQQLDHKYQIQSTLKECQAHLRNSEELLRDSRAEQQQLKAEHAALRSTHAATAAQLQETKVQLAALAQYRSDRELGDEQQAREIARLRDGKQRAEQEARSLRDEMAVLETRLSQSQADVTKANSIIGKLTQDVSSDRARLKTTAQVILKQEEVISQQKQQLDSVTARLSSLENTIQTDRQRADKAEQELLKAQEMLQEKQAKIESNENVINWLHRELSDNNMKKLGGGNAHSHDLTASQKAASAYIGCPSKPGDRAPLKMLHDDNVKQVSFSRDTKTTAKPDPERSSPVLDAKYLSPVEDAKPKSLLPQPASRSRLQHAGTPPSLEPPTATAKAPGHKTTTAQQAGVGVGGDALAKSGRRTAGAATASSRVEYAHPNHVLARTVYGSMAGHV